MFVASKRTPRGHPPETPKNRYFIIVFLCVFLRRNAPFEHLFVSGRPDALLDALGTVILSWNIRGNAFIINEFTVNRPQAPVIPLCFV